MKSLLVVVVFAALGIELVNFFLLAPPIDVGYSAGTPWYIQLLGLQWVALHAIGLFSLDWFEKVCGCNQLNVIMGCRRVDTVVLFVSGYLTTAFLVFVCIYGSRQIAALRRKRSTAAVRLANQHLR